MSLSYLAEGLPLNPLPPPVTERSSDVPHAPRRPISLSDSDTKIALTNALRYFPSNLHATLLPEFKKELEDYGHIYMYRFRPTEEISAKPLSEYPAKLLQCRVIQLMIQNNLDARVAQFPHELITYGGNGAVYSNWAQYLLSMKYLSEMTENQTLVMYSGHPLGLFPSTPSSPRVVVTNGMVIPNYSSKDDLERMYAQGVTIYGQMTAGSYCYIGPQGIVHGTVLTVLNAGRKYLGSADLTNKVFVTSGLGGMSGAQGKAGVITGAIAVVAEVDERAIKKRFEQGWVQEVISDLDELVARITKAKTESKAVSIAFSGNVVDLWERLADEADKGNCLVELGSDQTSCHNPFNGGYYPAGLTFDESAKMMAEDPALFKTHVQESLRRHVAALNRLSKKGMQFWDYGNSFLLEASRAKADVQNADGSFVYPSYVQDIMGDIFSLGFGPFRWVCTSGKPEDLSLTDKVAATVVRELAQEAPENTKQQYQDNLLWIEKAEENKLVVGSQARILYSDAVGRQRIAHAFNALFRDGKISAPVVISRDHHDVSGTDSPWRETSNIHDGSQFTADMAVQNFAGLSARGATWIALHNGGGTGWGEAINGGFGLVLDGTEDADARVTSILTWDVLNGVARRAWSGNDNAQWTIEGAMERLGGTLSVTLASPVDPALFQ